MNAIKLTWQNRTAYSQMMRADKPIGTYLLLWPTWWALWLASDGHPDVSMLLIFSFGVFFMRSAGCVINDYFDRNFDGAVERTKARPLASGRAEPIEALQLFFLLILVSFVLVLFLNLQTILFSFIALGLAATYPLMKRYTHFPQVVLGAAFSWGIPMAFLAIQTELPWVAWQLFITNLIWVVAYDTQYAMTDREDDLKIGIRSTAIFFGRLDKLAIGICQILFLISMVNIGQKFEFSAIYYIGLLVALTLMIYQHKLTWERERQPCFQAFLNNHWVGAAVAGGMIGHYLMN
ncbi:4-hydroxybenzoate octaprenyltransferase [Algicola sagamiensis]|uniref:4-hydroxybenzoate octaprenyltransferase n=1 Tax=Algicola sagamiensis TaxID=163869 RepID=UPI00036F5905|nr:4-hydroxybenzoate octaprenyltransferase [Algicola sagamiensis]